MTNRATLELQARARRLAAMPVTHRRRDRRASILLTLVGVLALAGCATGTNISVPGTGPLLTVTTRGGDCAGGPCGSSVILDRDGRVHSAAKPPNDLGTVPADKMAALTAVIQQTDFALIKAHPFTGQCPVAFDGQELIFEFSVGATTQRIASCDVEIEWSHPLFVAIGVALGEWIPIPLS